MFYTEKKEINSIKVSSLTEILQYVIGIKHSETEKFKMRKKNIQSKSLTKALKEKEIKDRLIENKRTFKQESTLWFRGLLNREWELSPYLYRAFPESDRLLEQQNILEDFLIQKQHLVYNYFPNPMMQPKQDDIYNWFSVVQPLVAIRHV